MKLSGTNTSELMARLIRKEFDDNQEFDHQIKLIKTANEFQFYELRNEMIADLSFESGLTERYLLEKINQ